MRLPSLGLKTKVLLGFVLALAIAAALFDWNWFRHPLERHLSENSHREVRIGDLHVDLDWSLEPTVRVRDAYVENAPWADKRPAATAGEASFTFSLKSLWEGRPVISRLVLIDADIDLERQADGLRNWRLRNPDNRGPGKVKVLRLEAQRTRIRFVRRDVNLDVGVAFSPLAAATGTGAASTTRIEFNGVYQSVAFAGEVLTGRQLMLLDTGESFPLSGHIAAGKTRFDIDGSIADLFKPSAMDANVRLAGPSLSALHPFVRVALPASRPYQLETHLRKTGGDYSFAELQAKVGRTDLSGEVHYSATRNRPMLRARLTSASADLADLESLVTMRQVQKGDAAGNEKPAAGITETRTGRLFSSHAIGFDHLKALDAQVRFDAKKLKAAALPALESLEVSADLSNGILSLKPIDVGLAGGNLVGSITMNAQHEPAAVHAKVDAQDMRIEKLLAGRRMAGTAAGPVAAHLDLKGRGTSIASMLGGASGTMRIAMRNGVISNMLDATLELNLAKILRALIVGNEAIAVNKVDIAFDFDKGLGHSRNIFLDTEQARVTGSGNLNLRDESLDILLTPHRKRPAILALDSSIRILGPLRQPRFEIVKKER